MTHAFLITCYQKASHTLKLIEQLDSDNSRFYLHINPNSTAFDNAVIKQLTANPHVHIIPERIAVKWGGFSLIRALIPLIKAALKDPDTRYIHWLSDSCYPIKTIGQIQTFFEENNGKEYLTCEQLPSKNWAYGGLFYIQYYSLYDIINVKQNKFYWELNKRFMHLQRNLHIKRKLPDDIPYFYGGRAPWWSLSRQALEHCMWQIDSMPLFYKRFSHTFCLEEILFQTLISNSPYKNNIANDDLRYLFKLERNGNNPSNLDMTDFDNIKQSHCLFARKFESPVSDELLQNVQTYLTKQETKPA